MTENKPPQMQNSSDAVATSADIDAYLASIRQQRSVATGRLMFALDATQSRQLTWDMACSLQAEMFKEVAAIGGLSIQLVYYRGLSECKASRWISESSQLLRLMEGLDCRAGKTQIGKVLAQAKRETRVLKVSALVFVGDALEESLDELVPEAHELGRLKVPCFLFQEGHTPKVEQAFREIARVTGGAYCRFDSGAAKQLRELLKAAALFAVGGVAALEGRKDAGSIRLIGQLKS